MNVLLSKKNNEIEELKKRHNRSRKMKLQPLYHPMTTQSTESLNESDVALFTKTLSLNAHQRAAQEIKKIDLGQSYVAGLSSKQKSLL